MAPSQTDIAKLTGFSHSTVSRSLAGSPLISEDTKRKVLEVAERLGYRRNAVVSNLMALLRANGSTPIRSAIAYVTFFQDDAPRNINRNYELYHLGAKRRAEKLGYHLDIICRTAPRMTRSKLSTILQTRGIRGMIIAPRENPLGHLSIDWPHFAMAVLGHPSLAPHLHSATPHHLYNTHLALRHLTKLGYQRIGLVLTGRQSSYFGSSVVAAFSFHQQKLTRATAVPPFLKLLESSPEADSAAKKWLLRHRPEVIVCAGNSADRLIAAAGLNTPGDVAVADLALPEQSTGRAGVWERTETVGAMAVDLVVGQLHHNEFGLPPVAKSVQIEGVWCDGTSAPPRRAARRASAQPKPSSPARTSAGMAAPGQSRAGRSAKGRQNMLSRCLDHESLSAPASA